MTPSRLNRYPDQSRTDDWIVTAGVVVAALACVGAWVVVRLALRWGT
jgi:hypothetical protein